MIVAVHQGAPGALVVAAPQAAGSFFFLKGRLSLGEEPAVRSLSPQVTSVQLVWQQ